ncbi:hypothetical protein [Kribbella sp. NPDC004875]|uniref:hypothetical protein n=1 Tax=Kribbella sp. NPDC004875 TaxID=3364107 RepID=UPI0036C6F217
MDSDWTADEPRSRADACLLFGCFVPIGAAVVGFVTWVVVDHFTPCDCDGEPDAEFYDSMAAFPFGLLAFAVTLALFIVVLTRRRR